MSARETNYAGGNDTSYAITASKATTAVLPFNGLAGGVFLVPSGSSLTSLAFHPVFVVAGTVTTATNAHKDDAATPASVTMTVAADGTYTLPVSLHGARNVAIVGNTTGTIYVQAKS
jgi:hypothetical protein